MRITLVLLLTTFLNTAISQDIVYARQLIKILSSPEFHGRGYVSRGDKKAAAFIRREMNHAGLRSFDGFMFYQPFSINVNTFPGKLSLQADTTTLQAGRDFVIFPASTACSGTYPVRYFSQEVYRDSARFIEFFRANHHDEFVVVDCIGEKEKHVAEIIKGLVQSNGFGAKGVVLLQEEEPIFASSPVEGDFCGFWMKKSKWPVGTQQLRVEVENEFLENYSTNNVIGYIPGRSDSVILLSAHYDHLGRMGQKTYYPGANDNASGTAMLLDLAHLYGKRKEQPAHSMLFVAFSGEENGLLGSTYFVNNPLVKLDKIKLMLNLDMVGSGSQGITVVNGAVFRADFNRLKQLNEKHQLLPEVAQRGAAANSDHYPFYEKGVKSFFVYTRGSYKEYHNIYDKHEQLPLTEYEDLCKLITLFLDSY